MARKFLIGTLLLTFIFSCTAEKLNLSPVSEGDTTYLNSDYTERVDNINYTSEVTNLVSSFPKFKSDAVNAEVTKLKYFLKDYVGGFQAYNLNGMQQSHQKYEKSYKKLQTLKKFLNPDEADVLNRYLVRIKSTMNNLEEQKHNNSLSKKE